jgi:hypothetical protein
MYRFAVLNVDVQNKFNFLFQKTFCRFCVLPELPLKRVVSLKRFKNNKIFDADEVFGYEANYKFSMSLLRRPRNDSILIIVKNIFVQS